MDQSSTGHRLRRPLVLLLLVGAAIAPHAGSVGAGFSFDDRDFVELNESVHSLSGVLGAFLSPFPPEQPARGLYRPLTAVSYAIDHVVGSGRPWAFHATNLLLYAICCVLAYLLLAGLLSEGPAALFAALWFALHPVHCEVVDSVAGRSELLALLFSLGACLSATRARLGLALPALLCAAAALSKETGAMAAPLALAFAFSAASPSSAERGRRLLGLTAAASVVLAAYLGLRLSALGRLGPGVDRLDALGIGRLGAVGRIFLEQFRVLAWPSTLQIDFYYEQKLLAGAHASALAVAGFAALATALAAIALAAARAWKTRDPVATSGALGGAAFLLFWLPTAHLLPLDAVFAERFLFAPSFGVAFALGAALEAIRAQVSRTLARALVAGALLALAALGVRASLRASDWSSELSLWEAAEPTLAPDVRLFSNLARAHLLAGDPSAALGYADRALALEPTWTTALNVRGMARMQLGDLRGARTSFERALASSPQNATALNNLGTVAIKLDDYPLARDVFRRSLAANPNHATARANLAKVVDALRRAEQYLASLDRAPEELEDPTALLSAARAARALGDRQRAQRLYERARDRGLPPDPAFEEPAR